MAVSENEVPESQMANKQYNKARMDLGAPYFNTNYANGWKTQS